jgi:hypothetical protein
MRLFEFEFPRHPGFIECARTIHPALDEHYGVTGGKYIELLVKNRESIRAQLGPAIEALEREFSMDGRERFWSQAAALTLFGGKLAKDWGLIQFDPEVIRPWLLQEIRRMRAELSSAVVSSETLLGEYLDAHVGERLVVTKLNQNVVASNTRPTRGALSQRYDRDANVLWISRSHIQEWLRKRNCNVNLLKRDLQAAGILLNSDDRKILGAGTDLSSGQQIPCWKIKADHLEVAPKLNVEKQEG